MNRNRRALVIGGGIAGPAVALLLARHGIDPVVFEAYPRTDVDAGGLQIAPNGMRVVAELGVAEALVKQGHPCSDMAFRNHHGRDIGLVRTADAGAGLNVARSAIHRVLRDELDRRGVPVRFEKRLADVTLAGREVVASFADGTTEVGDFLVGADGVRSRVRAWMLPDAAPRDTGMVSIGGFCRPGAVAPADPRDAERLTFVVGPRHQFGYSLMGPRLWGWWCHAHGATEEERRALLDMPGEDLRARMLERYAGWADPVGPLIRATEGWLRTRIHDVPALPVWHRGPVVLLGDAAHAMSPAGGQGASLALEDAHVFASLVAAPARHVEDAMAEFETLRRARAEGMVAQAYANDRRSLKELGPLGQWTRDRVMMPVFARLIGRALNRIYKAPLPG
ncbi:MAG TPA: FAD-dependent monooxygenase [Polyangiaceae bacterium]|jgi:2-polyprenyl-6-methoxyphenol hydroxylase-like FAD-dependent oxidoreductase